MAEAWGAALYGDPCRQCGWEWPQARESIEFVDGVSTEFAEVLDGVDGSARHPDLGWSATGYVAHVGDDLRQWAERAAGVLAGGTTQVLGHDPDLLAAARGDDSLGLQPALWSLQRSASAWSEVLREAVSAGVVLEHAAHGDQRAQDIARDNAHDAHHHLWDVRRIVAFQRWPHPGTLVVGGAGVRLSTPEDAELLTGWLADPRVHRWWGGEPVPPSEVRRKYTGVRAPDVVVYLVVVEEQPVGLLEAWHDPDGSAGLDMFLAAEAQGRGTGPRVARALAEQLTRSGWGTLTVDPAVDNDRAIEAWRRAGFVPTGARGEDDGHETLLMAFRP